MNGAQHILVVDDEPDLRKLVSDFLTRNGYHVFEARDGVAMMETMKSSRIDLVILDITMPGEDGLSLCRRLRVAGTTPIIMLTAMGTEIDRIVGLEMGADDYLPKPFNTAELLARIRAVLRRFQSPARASAPGADRVYRVRWLAARCCPAATSCPDGRIGRSPRGGVCPVGGLRGTAAACVHA